MASLNRHYSENAYDTSDESGGFGDAIDLGFVATWIRLAILGTAPGSVVELSFDGGTTTGLKLGPSTDRPLYMEIYNGDISQVSIKCAADCNISILATV